jgi:hypothetical protein
MNKVLFWIGILVGTPFCLSAQTGYPDAGGRTNGMGNASVALTDVFSIQNNPAAMAFAEQAAVGLSTQNFFMVEGGINAYYGAGIIPVKSTGAIGISAHYTGDQTFNQTKIGIGYGRKLADQLSVGVQLDYVGTRTGEVGNGQAFTFDIGVLYSPTKTISIGAKAFNPIRAENGMDNPEELPAIINAGFSWKPSDKVLFCIEGEQNLDYDLRIKSGLEYRIIDEIYLRGGYISNPSMFTSGIGIKLKTFQLDASAQFHQQLGITPGFGLQYSF